MDPAKRSNIHVPCSLAAALHAAMPHKRLRNLISELFGLLQGSIWAKLCRLFVLLVALAAYVVYGFWGDVSFAPPYVHNLVHEFFPKNLLKLVIDFFGGAGLFAILFKVVFPKSPSFDGKAEKAFAEQKAYFRALARIGARGTVALLIDNAKALDLTAEVAVINSLLELDSGNHPPDGPPPALFA
jgi:hypothetical protein